MCVPVQALLAAGASKAVGAATGTEGGAAGVQPGRPIQAVRVAASRTWPASTCGHRTGKCQPHPSATCPLPAPTLICNTGLNDYAIWRSHDLPNGHIHFDEVYFTYLPGKR
jgi:hypothetical protein